MIDVGPQAISGTGRIPVSPVFFGDVTQDSDDGPWLFPRVLVASAHRCSLLCSVLFVSLHLALTSDCSPRASSRGFFLFFCAIGRWMGGCEEWCFPIARWVEARSIKPPLRPAVRLAFNLIGLVFIAGITAPGSVRRLPHCQHLREVTAGELSGLERLP